jgi:hypothetical protein
MDVSISDELRFTTKAKGRGKCIKFSDDDI